jgi:hypothetical protein
MQRARYTDAITDDEECRNERRFNLLPNNNSLTPQYSGPCVFTSPQTTTDSLMTFCQRQARAIPVYIFDAQRDGTAWLDDVLIPFATANTRFQPVLIIDVHVNTTLRDFFNVKSLEQSISFCFKGMFYGFERMPIDLPKLLQMHSGRFGTDYYT